MRSSTCIVTYRTVGNFGEVLIWRFGEFGKDRQIKSSPKWIITCVSMALRIQMAKLKIRQYLLRANSPNLMLAKFSRYTVWCNKNLCGTNLCNQRLTCVIHINKSYA